MVTKYYRLLLMFISMAALLSCAADTDDEYTNKTRKKATRTSTHKYKYSVYLENSGSLNGYLTVSGDSNFKSNVNDFITVLNGFPEKQSLNLYDINTVTIPVALNADAAQVNDYISGFNATTFKARSKANGGNQAQSDLQHILKTILDKNAPDEVSMLISDGIFSPGRNRNALDYLSQQRSGIHGFIAEKLRKQPFSTLILQFHSDFKGVYYYQDNNSRNGSFNDRPYYFICVGKQEALFHLLDLVRKQRTFKGFREFLFLTDSTQYHIVSHIRNTTEYYEYDQEEPMTISNISQGGRDNKFRIKFSMNLSPLPVSDAYLLNRNNYIISSGYAIDSIYRSGQDKFTHEVILVAPKPQTGTLAFSLKKQLPDWIHTSNLDEDKGMTPDELEGKTFGIRYLLEGIYNAYAAYDQHSDYFSISISVKE